MPKTETAIGEKDEPNNYQVIQERTRKDLERSVRIEMLRDWLPQGGVAVDDEYFYQAMVLRKD